MAFNGTVLKEQTFSVTVPARGQQVLPLSRDLAVTKNPAAEILVAETAMEAGFNRAIFNHVEPLDQLLEPDALKMEVKRANGGFDVTITATSYVRDAFLQVDRVDSAARVDAGLISLLPGESFTFHVQGATSATAEDFDAPFILCSVNSLGTGKVPNRTGSFLSPGSSQ
jgi:beta-mannosidase